ncbi:MAG: class I SAM-dependent methyltransferase [Fibrobacterota bacterium]
MNLSQEQTGAYSEAVKSGLYNKKSGLVGKYDNVRRYWEDENTRLVLYPHIHKLIERCRERMRRLRIMDLGCGSADGLELLFGIKDKNADLHDTEIDLLNPENFGFYKGLDLNTDLLDQARSIYGGNPKITFEKGDFSRGLPLSEDEEPYDLYFTSYGSSSHHNNDETHVNLLKKIAEKTKNYSIVVCDWVGRYSYEWQELWTEDLKSDPNMDYVVSYIYEKEEREKKRDSLQHITLRVMCKEEAELLVKKASGESGIPIKPLEFFDRSIFTGRHMDTAEYNQHARPLRRAVNSLHEENVRTDLNTLIVDYVPKKGFDFFNNYFDYLQVCWNTLVRYSSEIIYLYNEKEKRFSGELPKIYPSYPEPLKEMMTRMKNVVEGIGWLTVGMPRENIIEPQLGYALRNLMSCMQKGQGCAHGLIGIFEIDKTKDSSGAK